MAEELGPDCTCCGDCVMRAEVNQVTDTYNADNTFEIPVGITCMEVECWGSGGNGEAGAPGTSSMGGGGGAYSFAQVPVTTAQVYVIVVDTAGAELSTRVYLTGSPGSPVCAAGSGANGSTSLGSFDGAGGPAGGGTGTVRFSGGNGATGHFSSSGFPPVTIDNAGGGGGSATAIADGGNGVAGSSSGPGAGGTGEGNGGNGGNRLPAPASDGGAGSAPGGGGGGAISPGNSAGVGAAGRVRITY